MTSPLALMIMPVPWSSLPWDLTSMETTEGSSFLASWTTLTLPLRTAAPGAALLSWMVTPELSELLLSARAVTPAPTRAPMRAAMMATGTRGRWVGEGEGEGEGGAEPGAGAAVAPRGGGGGGGG